MITMGENKEKNFMIITHRVVHGLAASASSGSLLGMHILRFPLKYPSEEICILDF